MKYEEFKKLVKEKCWTIADLRCDNAPPTEELLEVMDQMGLEKYERYVLKLETEGN